MELLFIWINKKKKIHPSYSINGLLDIPRITIAQLLRSTDSESSFKTLLRSESRTHKVRHMNWDSPNLLTLLKRNLNKPILLSEYQKGESDKFLRMRTWHILLSIGQLKERSQESRIKEVVDHVGHSQQSETLKLMPESGMERNWTYQNKNLLTVEVKPEITDVMVVGWIGHLSMLNSMELLQEMITNTMV